MVAPPSYDTAIIGGGLAGIAVALRRKKRGDSVLLIEKNKSIGGKIAVASWRDYRWDKGPSLFTMPQLVDELYTLYGKNPRDYFNYVSCAENCRYFYPDGTSFSLYSAPEKRTEALRSLFSEKDVRNVEAYLEKAAATYQSIGDLFIDAPQLRPKDALRMEIIKQYPQLLSSKMRQSLNRYNEKKFEDPKLVQLFNRFGTYNGSDPYQMSGLYSMVPHLELNRGTYFPKGGMRAIVNGLTQLMEEEGIEVMTEEEHLTASLAKGGGYTLKTSKGSVTSRQLVSAVDVVHFYRHILNNRRLADKYAALQRSTSALLFYWAVDKKVPRIGLHNVFFSSDYRDEFSQLFDEQRLPTSPTIYVHNSSTIEERDAPREGQNWFVMINTPAGVEPLPSQIDDLKSFILQQLSTVHDMDITSHIVHEQRWTMKGIQQDTGAHQGALYGTAVNSKLASFKRHGNTHKQYPRLYFAGGTVHPGGGIPLVLKSAKIVDQLMEQDG